MEGKSEMEKNIKVHEKYLYEIWKKQEFIKDLKTKDGQTIQVIDAGSENKELGGPDFRNARIKIGYITYCGDVEIDCYQSDWKTHGHSINKKYNKVILHAALNNNSSQGFVFTQEGRKVQSVALSEFLTRDVRKVIQQAITSESKQRINKMPCSELNQLIEEKVKLDFVYDLGMERFRKKTVKMLERLKEITYINELSLKEPVIRYDLDEAFHRREFKPSDFSKREIWQQLIYESIFEALGYSKNKDIMQRLSEACNIRFLKAFLDKEDFTAYCEAALFNISNLMPDVHELPDEETSAYTKKLAELWSEIKGNYDGRTFNAAQWHFFKLRPQNFPTVRIAGGARLLTRILKSDLISDIIKTMETINVPKKLENKLRSMLIVKGEGFWKHHYVFDQPSKVNINYFIGVSRADEILVNVILPVLSVYFEIFKRPHLAKKIVRLYTNYYQISENNLVDEVASTLSLNNAWKRSILYQGMIELFRNFCSRNKCLECTIGKDIFT